MAKTTRLSEYKKGYDLITDDELNKQFNTYLDTLKSGIINQQAAPYTHYWISYTSNNPNMEYGVYYIKETQDIKSSPSEFAQTALKISLEATADVAVKFIKDYPNKTPVLSIFCLSAGFAEQDPSKISNGLVISGQTADGRCCMAWYKTLTDDKSKIIGFETKEEYIPKKHVDDEEYIWEGNEKLIKIINKLISKKS